MIITPAEIRRLFSFPHFLPEKPLMLYNILLLFDIFPQMSFRPERSGVEKSPRRSDHYALCIMHHALFGGAV